MLNYSFESRNISLVWVLDNYLYYLNFEEINNSLKGVFAKNPTGNRLNLEKCLNLSLLSVEFIKRKLLKTLNAQ